MTTDNTNTNTDTNTNTYNPDTDRPTNLVEVIVWCKHHNIAADIVGRWVWVRFEDKPDAAVRDALKTAGFRWVRTRGEWAHNCGHPSHRGHGNPRYKYGEIPVRMVTDRDLAGVA